MRAMILAAGRGQRMRPLTDHTPKPLLPVAGKPLIVWHIEKLASAGIKDIVVNNAWLGEQIVQTLGDGSAWGVRIEHSSEETALETAGGIASALPHLGAQPFLVINGDIWCDWPLSQALSIAHDMANDASRLAHLVLVNNPAHHPEGDFAISDLGNVQTDGDIKFTFSGIGLYRPALFADVDPYHPTPLAPLLRQAMMAQGVTGEYFEGAWMDIGTPERLAELDRSLTTR